jgi:carbonic anhydrase/acetyltransferase-like protein (isoleucine patch superfamily)
MSPRDPHSAPEKHAGMILSFDGFTPRIDPTAFIAPTAVIIGDVVIGPGANIWYGCILRGDGNQLRVGARTNIQDGTIVHLNSQEDHGRGAPGYRCLIGDDVTIGHMALIHACTLEDGAFVGMKACVMDGAVVEGGAMVAAGALVTPGKRVRRGELWAGSPAKLLRQLTPKEMEDFASTAPYYAELGAHYRAQGL